jgi:hypothetical protein
MSSFVSRNMQVYPFCQENLQEFHVLGIQM